MNKLTKLLNRIIKLNQSDIFKKVFGSDEVKDFIINLNTQEQLFKKGADANNTSLEAIGGDYSNLTIEGVPGLFLGKKQRGLPTDRVTLFDTGEFYTSFEVEVKGDEIIIMADTVKDDGTDLIDRWGKDIIGLNEESRKKLIEFALPIFKREVKRAICGV